MNNLNHPDSHKYNFALNLDYLLKIRWCIILLQSIHQYYWLFLSWTFITIFIKSYG